MECAGVISACAAACVVTDGEACIECLGPSYDLCKDCFNFSNILNKQVTFQSKFLTIDRYVSTPISCDNALNIVHVCITILLTLNYTLRREKGYFTPAMVTTVAPVNGYDGYFP